MPRPSPGLCLAPKDGPIFYDLSASVPTPVNANTLHEAIVEAAAQSGLDPAKAYAIRKTGRIISAGQRAG